MSNFALNLFGMDFFNNLMIYESLCICFDIYDENTQKIILQIFHNKGAKLPPNVEIVYDYWISLHSRLLKYIETSTNCSNIVPNLEFSGDLRSFLDFDVELSERAKNIQKREHIYDKKRYKVLSYEIANIHHPKEKFLIRYRVDVKEDAVDIFQIWRIVKNKYPSFSQ
ncbi:hypothetical protein ACQ4LE_001462 [Meloidogyne hapla]|uniref:EthD domain-containing protein n=1 Tax=Meloidogyne hapla TaxID=6305 RepID=A0A1I8AXA6_MELHA